MLRSSDAALACRASRLFLELVAQTDEHQFLVVAAAGKTEVADRSLRVLRRAVRVALRAARVLIGADSVHVGALRQRVVGTQADLVVVRRGVAAGVRVRVAQAEQRGRRQLEV